MMDGSRDTAEGRLEEAFMNGSNAFKEEETDETLGAELKEEKKDSLLALHELVAVMDSSGDTSEGRLEEAFMNGSNAYVVEETDETLGAEGEDEKSDSPLREQDRFLPIANVARIMKKSIPASGKIAKDAKECVQECVSEFISFITSEASERCHQEKRKTINGEDILFAMSTLGFDNYVEPLKVYLQKYRESAKGEKTGVDAEGMQELPEDLAQTLSSGQIMTTDQNGQQNVIFAALASGQLASFT